MSRSATINQILEEAMEIVNDDDLLGFEAVAPEEEVDRQEGLDQRDQHDDDDDEAQGGAPRLPLRQ